GVGRLPRRRAVGDGAVGPRGGWSDDREAERAILPGASRHGQAGGQVTAASPVLDPSPPRPATLRGPSRNRETGPLSNRDQQGKNNSLLVKVTVYPVVGDAGRGAGVAAVLGSQLTHCQIPEGHPASLLPSPLAGEGSGVRGNGLDTVL